MIFKQSTQTDHLKPKCKIQIGEELIKIKWKKDYSFDRPILKCSDPDVPAHQSPQNILNALDDDCLRSIFRQLDHFDQCAILDVCQRFRDVLMGFKPKVIEITNDNCWPLWKLERFVRTFGPSIETARITTDQCPDILMVFLTQYCPNLVELEGMTRFKNTMNEMAPLFPRLRRIDLNHKGTATHVFQPNTQFESIRVRRMIDLPPLHFPALREFKANIGRRNEYSTEQFFALNRQVKKLAIGLSLDFPMSRILVNLPDLVEFHASSVTLNADVIRSLCQLRHLHTLRFDVIRGEITPMLREFVYNDMQLKHLKLIRSWNGAFEFDATGYLVQMKSLESIQIHGVGDDEVHRIVNGCINLKEFVIMAHYITPQGILDAMRCEHRVEKATFNIFLRPEVMLLLIAQSDQIDAIAELRASRSIDVQVKLCYDPDNIYPPAMVSIRKKKSFLRHFFMYND